MVFSQVLTLLISIVSAKVTKTSPIHDDDDRVGKTMNYLYLAYLVGVLTVMYLALKLILPRLLVRKVVSAQSTRPSSAAVPAIVTQIKTPMTPAPTLDGFTM